MKRCPICGSPVIPEVPKGSFPEKLAKIAKELSRLSPEEVAKGIIPEIMPIALEATNEAIRWLDTFKTELQREE